MHQTEATGMVALNNKANKSGRNKQSTNIIMTDDLIVDFPRQCNLRRVRFSETSELLTYERHDVARRELWFTTEEYNLMALVRQRDVLRLRAERASNEAADDDVERSGSWIGLAHLLTQAIIDEVRACRARCILAVLTEQARQGPSASASLDSCEAIALASSVQTRQPALRARRLGELHRDAL